MNILVKFPTRNRPHKFLQVYNKLLETSNDIQTLVSYDSDDPTMTPEIVQQAIRMSESIVLISGESKSKIDACNRDVNKIPAWDIVVLMSDDMIPQVEGWDDIMREDMKENFPDTDGALWYHDGYQDSICTMVVMGKKYYDRFGYLYHPDYTSLWSDNEQTEVALSLNKMFTSTTCLFRHEHPMNTQTVAMDALYKRNEPYYHIDKKVYDDRKAKGFPNS